MTDIRIQAKVRRAREGKAHSKRKKLHRLRGIVVDGRKEVDVGVCATSIASHFSSKWKGTGNDQQFASEIGNMDPFLFQLTMEEVADAFRNINHKDTIKRDGICSRSLELLFIAQPLHFIEWLSSGLGDPSVYRRQTVAARALGKEHSYSLLEQIRLVIPLDAWMSLTDSVISIRLEAELQQAFPDVLHDRQADGYFMGANRYTQPLDIAFGLQQAVEKALDMESRGGVAQFDISQFYDSLPLARLYHYLLQLGVDPGLVKAAMLHQLLPVLQVTLSATASTLTAESSLVSHRWRGNWVPNCWVVGQIDRRVHDRFV
jgi:hypothetical protein